MRSVSIAAETALIAVLDRGAEAGPRNRQQHADDDHREDECVLDERLTLVSAQARKQLLKQGHPVLPNCRFGAISAPLEHGVGRRRAALNGQRSGSA